MRFLVKALRAFFKAACGRAGSAARARERLKVIVLCDRISLDRSAMEALKAELTEVVARYVEVDPAAARLEVARDRSGASLVAVFPVKGV